MVVCCAQSEVAALREQVEATPMPEFAQSLIAEKNAEIDHLNEQMKQLKSHGHASDDQVHIQQLVSETTLSNLPLGLLETEPQALAL